MFSPYRVVIETIVVQEIDPMKNPSLRLVAPQHGSFRFLRAFRPPPLWALPLFTLAFATGVNAANTGDIFKTTATDMSVGTNYTTTITPTAATTTDVQLSGTYTSTTLTGNGTALSFGTLNDLDATQALVITNTNATAGSITLSTPANSTSGSNAADLLYVAAGADLTLQSGTGTLTLNINNSGNIDNAGTLSLAGPISILAAKTATFTGAGATTVGGVIAATTGIVAINAAGGSVTLGGTNLYTGGTTLTAGTLNFNNTKSVGTGTLTINGGILDNTSGAAIVNANNVTETWGGDFTFSGQIGGAHDLNLGTGAITFTGANRTVTTNAGTLTAGGTVTNGGFNLIKAGAGTLSLPGAISGAGNVTVSGGTLILGSANTYTGGTNLNGGVLVNNVAGATLGTSGNITFGGGTLQYGGAIPGTDYSARFKNSTGAISLDLTNKLFTLASALDSTNTGGFTVYGNTTNAVLSLTANSTYTGATVVRGGALAINGAAGQLSGTTSITVSGGQLSVGDGTLLLSNRLGTGASLTLGGVGGGGIYTNVRPASGTANTTITSLTVAPGASSISQLGNGTNVLNVTNGTSQYVRQTGGVLEVNGGGGVVNLTFTTAPTTSGNSFIGTGTSAMLLGYVIEGSTWNFNQPGAANTPSVSSNDVFTSGTNANVTKADTISATSTVQSINFTSSSQVALTTNAALTVQSGGILFGGNGATAGALNGGVINGTGSIQAASGLDLWIGTGGGASASALIGTSTISATILDDGTGKGLTKFGVSTLLLSGNNSYTGPVYLNAGTLAIGSANGLGLASSTANLNFLGNTTLQASGSNFSSIRNVVIAGGRTATIDTNGQSIGLSGVISQSGSTAGLADSLGNLTKVGNGTLTLNGAAANTYTGLTTVNAGTLLLDNSNFVAATNLVDNNSGLVLGSGNLTVKGRATGATSQSFNGTTLTTNTGGSITTNTNGGSGVTVNLGTVVHNAGTSLNFDTSAGGTITFGAANATLGYATVKDSTGVGLALVNNGVISRLTGQTTLTNVATNGNANYITSGALNMTQSTFTVQSLTLNGTSGVGTLDLGGASNVMSPASHGLLSFGSNAYTIQNGQVGAANTELDVHTMGTGGLTISGTIGSGSASLVKDGSDVLTLSGTNAYTGVTVVNGGTLSLTGTLGATATTVNSGATLSITGTTSGATTVNYGGTLNIGAGGTINNALVTINNGGNITENATGIIAGTGSVTVATGNIGTITLAGANTYTGATTVNGGMLNAGIASVTGTSGAFGNGSALTLANVVGTGINLNGFDTTIGSITGGGVAGGSDTLGANTLTVGTNNTSPAVYAGTVSGTGSLVKVGTGTLLLSGANSYSGGMTVKNGAVILQSATGAGTNTITLGDSTPSNSNSASLGLINVTATNAINVAAGSSGTLTIGQGTATSGTLSGPVTLANNVTLGAVSGTGGLNTTITGGITGTGNVILASNNAASGGSVTISTGAVNMVGSITSNGTVSTNANTINSVIGTNVTGVTQNSATAALVLAGANLYTADTTAQSGTLNLLNSLALQKSTLNLNGGTVTFGSTTVAITAATVGGLAGSGNITLANQSTVPAAVNLTIGNSNTSTGFNTLNPTLAGNILQSGALTVTVTKVGTNTQTLSGNNTWTGLTTLAGGTLNAGSANALNSVANSGGVRFTGGTLQYSALTSDYSSKMANSTGAISIDTNGNSAALASSLASSNTGGLTKLGAGTLTLSAANAYTGTNTFTGGTVAVSAANNLGNSANTLAFNGGTLELTANTVTLNGAATVTAGSTANFQVDSGANLTLNGIVGQSASSGGLTKTGLGTLTLAGSNTYTGLTTISAGIVDYTNSTAFGVNSAITVASGATARVADGIDGGPQTLTLAGTGAAGTSGALEALGFTTYSGSIVLSADATIASDSVLLILNGSTISGAGKTLTVAGAADTEIDSAITTGSGGLVQNSTATTSLLGANTYTGATTVSNGTLKAGIASVAGVSGAFGVNSAVTVSNVSGAAVDLDGNNTQIGSLAGGGSSGGNVALGSATLTTGANNTSTTYAGSISGSGSVTKIGTGVWNLTGASLYSGGTTVTGGGLKVNNTSGSATGSGLVTIQTAATLSGGSTALNGGSLVTLGTLSHIPTLQTYAAGVTGVIGGPVTVESGGHLAPGNSVGTITMASLTLNSGSVLDYEFNGSANDFTSISGTLTLNGGGLNLYQEGGTTAFNAPGTYDLFSYGSLDGFGIGALSVLNPNAGYTYTFFNDSADNLIQLQIAVVPEPGTWAMMIAGLGALFFIQSRRRRSN